MDIGAWLRELALERYERVFRDNDIDIELLPDLTSDDLKELGIASLGHRKRLLKAISFLSRPPPEIHARQAGAVEASATTIRAPFCSRSSM